MAVGTIPNVNKLNVSQMTQQQVAAHASGFELLGLIVISNHARPDSRNTIVELTQGWVSALCASCTLAGHAAFVIMSADRADADAACKDL